MTAKPSLLTLNRMGVRNHQGGWGVQPAIIAPIKYYLEIFHLEKMLAIYKGLICEHCQII